MLHHNKRHFGVEMSHSFGDCMFSLPLIKSLSEHNMCKIGVATQKRFSDAFFNIPFISEIVLIDGLTQGLKKLGEMGYERVEQITPHHHFPIFKDRDPSFCLIDTHLRVGRLLGCADFDQRPIFTPTNDEEAAVSQYSSDKPLIAIESIANSGQSWCDKKAVDMIINRHRNTHRILWCSNQHAPNLPFVDDCLRYTRRQIICLLRKVEIFYTTGSGFFCASMALPHNARPNKIVCLWIDDVYKYEHRLSQLGWHPNIVWVHNHQELQASLG